MQKTIKNVIYGYEENSGDKKRQEDALLLATFITSNGVEGNYNQTVLQLDSSFEIDDEVE